MSDNPVSIQLLHNTLRYDPKTGLLYWITDRANGKVKAGSRACHPAAKGYLAVFLEGKKRKAHHIVWAMHKGYWPQKLDHKDGVRNNNLIDNLRETSSILNAANRGLNKNNKLKTRGVHQIPSGKYRATITHLGIKHDLGVFESAELASIAYEAKSKELRKDYHRDC